MKTEVKMERKLFGVTVLQQSSSEFFSAKDLVLAGNKYRIANDLGMFNLTAWFNKKSTKEFVLELEAEYGKVISKGKKTWIHPFLFIDLALAISPKLKIEAYKWMYDELLSNRNNSGNSYKKMCGSLFAHQGNKQTFQGLIIDTAKRIKDACGVVDWQSASEDQLKKRDKIHNDICLLANVLNNNAESVRLALLQNK